MAKTRKQHILVNDCRVYSVKPGIDPNQKIADLESKGLKVKRVKSPPTIKTMEKWSFDGVARATDGCRVEPDGQCIHGHKSWLLVLGYI